MIVQLQAIVRLTGGLDRAEAHEAPNAVIGMHHDIADREGRGLCQRVGGFGLACLPHEPIAQNILLADNGDAGRLEASLERQHRHGHCVLGGCNRVRKDLDAHRAVHTMLGQKRGEPFARARAPAGHDDDLLRRNQCLGMGHDSVEDIGAFGLPFRRERSSLSAAKGHDGDAVRFRAFERVESDHMRCSLQEALPLDLGQEHAVGRDRVIRRRTKRLPLQRFGARIMVVGDLLQTALAGIVRQRIERDDRASDIIEQRVEAIVKEREPMLHALMLLARRDGLVKRIVSGHGAEQLHVALPETASHVGRERHFAHGQEVNCLDAGFRTLRFGIEGTDRFQRIAEEVEADWLPARRIQIEDAAPYSILPRIGYRAGTGVAGRHQPLHELAHVQDIAGAKAQT